MGENQQGKWHQTSVPGDPRLDSLVDGQDFDLFALEGIAEDDTPNTT